MYFYEYYYTQVDFNTGEAQQLPRREKVKAQFATNPNDLKIESIILSETGETSCLIYKGSQPLAYHNLLNGEVKSIEPERSL